MVQQLNNYSVYKHVCPNGKVYIGITSQIPSKRWGVNGNYYKKQFFYRAIQKYGWDNIDHVIIAINLSKEDAQIAERKLIKRYKSRDSKFGYNLSTGGDSGSKGAHFSEETRRKMSETHKRMEHPNLRPRPSGWHHTEDTKRKLSLAKKGKKMPPMSEEQKRKIGESQKGELNHRYGKHWTEEEKKFLSSCHKKRALKATNVLTNEIEFFDGMRDAERKTGAKHSNICKYINTNKPLKGYIWEDAI